jgi:hypothetical protein
MMTSTGMADLFAPWLLMQFHSSLRWSCFPWLSWFPCLAFAEIELCVVDGDRQVRARMNFWLWLSTLATWTDLYKLTYGVNNSVRGPDKPKKRSTHRLREAAELREPVYSPPGTTGPCPTGERHVIVSGKLETGSGPTRRRRREAAELLIVSGLFSEKAVCGLVDDLIVPFVVERLIRISILEPASAAKG